MKGLEGSKLGRYELRFRVAQGGMSEVYLGYDRRVRRYVAVKVLYGSNEPFVRRFEREALAVGALSHEHILPLYEFGEQRPWYYLAMPFVEGGTLRDYLTRREQLTLEETGSFLEQIASALQHAHDHGVLHRDVKPSNILLRPDGHAYLADFGLAKAKLEAESLSHSGAMVGTPEYMAPEQSNGQNDQRSDIYSLGIILYQMLTGRVPFTSDSPVGVTLKHLQLPPPSPRQYNNTIPSAIEEVMLIALAKSPDERYQEARDLAMAYNKAMLKKRTHDLGEEAYALIAKTGDSAAHNETLTDKTRAIVEQITTQLPLTRPQLFPLEGETTSFIPHVAEMYKKKQRRMPLFVLLLCLGLSIGIAFILLFFVQPQFDQRQTHPGTDRNHHFSQTRAKATATAVAAAHQRLQATLAAQAREQATSGITAAIGAGNILYADTMTQRNSGWLNDGRQCYFTTQGYHVRTSLTHAVAWCYSNQQRYTNNIFSVQTQLLHGGFCALIFRLNPYYKTFYALELDGYGNYRFQRAHGNDPSRWLTLIDWTQTSALQSGYRAANALLVITDGPHFRFYFNRQLVLSTYTDQIYSTGLVGLLVGGDSSEGTEAIFKNLVIFQKQP
jgi:Serine/threonine protein kinase